MKIINCLKLTDKLDMVLRQTEASKEKMLLKRILGDLNANPCFPWVKLFI